MMRTGSVTNTQTYKRNISIVLLVVALAVGIITWLLVTNSSNSHNHSARNNLLQSPMVRDHQPIGKIAILAEPREGSTPPGLSPVVWLSGNDVVCFGALSLENPAGFASGSCVDDESIFIGEQAEIPNKPVFMSAPHVPGYALAIGVVRGGAKSIEVTLSSGKKTNSGVTRIKSPVIDNLGAYAVWLEVDDSSASWESIATIEAYNDAGDMIATLK